MILRKVSRHLWSLFDPASSDVFQQWQKMAKCHKRISTLVNYGLGLHFSFVTKQIFCVSTIISVLKHNVSSILPTFRLNNSVNRYTSAQSFIFQKRAGKKPQIMPNCFQAAIEKCAAAAIGRRRSPLNYLANKKAL